MWSREPVREFLDKKHPPFKESLNENRVHYEIIESEGFDVENGLGLILT